MVKNGINCAYGMVTRQMVSDMKGDMVKIEKKLDCMDRKITTAYNHMSSRLPKWATALITILSSITVGLIVRGVYV